MRKYQIWGFAYINNGKNINVLNGADDEVYEEFNIPCFNGFAYFKCNSGCYLMKYPKIQNLTKEDKERIFEYCGYYPTSGEYGVICGALGTAVKISPKIFKPFENAYPIKLHDCPLLDWKNGNIK